MPRRSSKKPPKDEVQAAFEAVARLTGGSMALDPTKDIAAQLLGRRGGLKGGNARAKSLSPERRSEIAKKAAETRWKKKRK